MLKTAAVATLTAATVLTALIHRLEYAVALLGLLVGGLGLLALRRRPVGPTLHDVVAAADADRATATARAKRVDRVLGALRKQVEHDAINLQRAQTRELEGLHQLYGGFTPRAPMPSSGQWALNPTDLLALLHLVERQRPGLVVELGSGTSTVWLAYALERLGGRVVSLDHDPTYAERTRAMLRAHGLEAVAEVRDAPLRAVRVRGADFDWYDVDALDDVDGIDLLLVDGPPGSVGPLSRYPAVDLLRHKLSPAATVVLDDLSRTDEQETLRRWAEENPGLTAEPASIGQHGVLSYARS
jgi:predicted O-methyltransferase YrrM